MKNITKLLESEGVPFFWQCYIASLLLVSLFTLFIGSAKWLMPINFIMSTFMLFGMLVGNHAHNQKKYTRLFLLMGGMLIGVANSISSLLYYDLPLNSNTPLFLEGLGALFIAFFAFSHMFMFEEKFKLKGFTIDYILLLNACLFFFLLISPNAINTLIYTFNFSQQLHVLIIILGVNIFSMSIIHFFLSKSFGFLDTLRIVLSLLLIIHFGLEALIFSEPEHYTSTLRSASLSSYQLVGTLAILFMFIEKLSLDFSSIAPFQMGNRFMWFASIIAILSFPMGLIIRFIQNAPPINLLLVGEFGAFLSVIIIWRFIVLIKDSNQQRKQLNSLLLTNTLTNLPNYRGYLEKLTCMQIQNVLVITINIDDFKAINDLYGRDSGDEVLKSLARRLEQLPKTLLVAHTHSDLFLAVFQTKETNINRLIKATHDSLGVWDTIKGKQMTVPLSYGGSYCKDIANPEKLAKQAEQALKMARSQHIVFSMFAEDTGDSTLPRHEIRDILQQSVDDNYLPVHFQPIYNLKDGSLKALELLIRVDTKKHGLLLPTQFLEQAKAYGLLTSLTQICVKMVAKHYATLPKVIININLPPYMLKSDKLLSLFIQLFKDEKLPPKRFCIEITEDEDIPTTALIPAIKKLKEYGFSIAMDDFGTGYSSLDRLSLLDIDAVKIDRSLLLSAASGNTAFLEWAISLSQRLGASAVVEGVETKEQLSLVKLLGADSAQGFLYSEPVAALQTGNIALNSNDISIA